MAEYNKKLTPEILREARSYMPLIIKDQWVKNVCLGCIDRVELGIKGDDGAMGAMPPFYKNNTERQARYLMGILVRYYLREEISPAEDDGIMSGDDYDRWAGNHVFNQLERFKSDATLRDKVFDLLSDYRDLEKRLNTEVYNVIQIQNDVVTRLTALIRAQTTPEATQQALSELKKAKEDVDKYLSAKQQKAQE